MLLRFTAPFDMSGSPTVTFPAHWTADGKPIGAQLVGPHWSEPLLVRAADCFQRLTNHHERRAELEPQFSGCSVHRVKKPFWTL